MSARDPYFFALELDVYQPSTSVQPFAYGRGSHPRGALTILASSPESSDTLRASDRGYRSRTADSIGLQVYPAVMDQAFEMDRQVSLDPTQASTATFGAVRLNNLGRRYDAYVQARNSDSRALKLLMGQKTFDAARGIYVDPPYASLLPFFSGFASAWALSEDELEVPIKDISYWADRALQTTFYTGLGGLGGGADLQGRPLPMTRGGTASLPVLNVPLTTVDAVNLIYQWTDGPGTVVTLYEGASNVFVYDGDVSDLYAGTAPIPGHYRTNNAHGVLQLGSSPVRTLTADVTGSFPTAGAITTAVQIARYVLLETLALPSAYLLGSSFDAADSLYPFTAGFYIPSSEAPTALSVLQTLLGSVGARLITALNGQLRVYTLRQISADAIPALALSPLNVISVTPQALPALLDPPPYRWRVGWGQIYTVQTSDFNGYADAARRAVVASQYQFASSISSSVQTAWRRPNDPAPVQTYLLSAPDAQSLADDLTALWASRPGLYAVEMPIDLATSIGLGSVVSLNWTLADLPGGKLGQIVGQQVRSVDATVIFSVLAGHNPDLFSANSLLGSDAAPLLGSDDTDLNG
jgi:hypothetical protein